MWLISQGDKRDILSNITIVLAPYGMKRANEKLKKNTVCVCASMARHIYEPQRETCESLLPILHMVLEN